MITCCKGCQIRHLNCHSNCIEYNVQKVTIQLLKEEDYKNKEAGKFTCSHERNSNRLMKAGIY